MQARLPARSHKLLTRGAASFDDAALSVDFAAFEDTPAAPAALDAPPASGAAASALVEVELDVFCSILPAFDELKAGLRARTMNMGSVSATKEQSVNMRLQAKHT